MVISTHAFFEKDFAASQSHVEDPGTERKRCGSTSLRTRRLSWMGGAWARTVWPTPRALNNRKGPKGQKGRSWRARGRGSCVWAFWAEVKRVQPVQPEPGTTCFCLTKYYKLQIGPCRLCPSKKNFNHGCF